MWCPTDIVVNGERHHFALPEPPFKPIYPNGQGMTYEVQEVRQCLLKGTRATYGADLVPGLLPNVEKMCTLLFLCSIFQVRNRNPLNPAIASHVEILNLLLSCFEGSRKKLHHSRSNVSAISGLKEHPLAPLSDSLKISRMLDEAKKQIGLVYEGDA